MKKILIYTAIITLVLISISTFAQPLINTADIVSLTELQDIMQSYTNRLILVIIFAFALVLILFAVLLINNSELKGLLRQGNKDIDNLIDHYNKFKKFHNELHNYYTELVILFRDKLKIITNNMVGINDSIGKLIDVVRDHVNQGSERLKHMNKLFNTVEEGHNTEVEYLRKLIRELEGKISNKKGKENDSQKHSIEVIKSNKSK